MKQMRDDFSRLGRAYFYWKSGIRRHAAGITALACLLPLHLFAESADDDKSNQPVFYDPSFVKGRSKEAQHLLELANKNMRENKTDEAILQYRSIIEIHPQAWQIHNALAKIYFQRGEYKKAADVIREVTKVYPNQYKAHANLGNALLRGEQYEESSQVFKKAMQINPEKVTAIRGYSAAMSGAKRGTKAVEFLKSILDGHPAVFAVLEELGRLSWENEKLDAAIDYYEQALKAKPESLTSLNQLSICYLQKGERDKALEHWKKAIEFHPNVGDAYNNVGFLYAQQGKIEEGIDWFEKAIKLKPNHVDANKNLGHIRAEQGKYEEAVRHLETAVAAKPKAIDMHFTLGTLYLLRLNDPERALGKFNHVIKKDPGNAMNYYYAGLCHSTAGKTDLAIKEYRRGLKISPDAVLILNNLAWILATESELPAEKRLEAVVLAEKASKLTHRKNPATLDTLSAAYASVGKFDEALRTATHALQLATKMEDLKLAGDIKRRVALYKRKSPVVE